MRVIPKIDRPDRPHRRRRRLRTVSTLPTLLTLGNLVCGLAAVHFCLRAMFDAGSAVSPLDGVTLNSGILERLLPSFLSIASGFIFVGLLLDALDGSVARLTHSTSDFGGQLDSLADVVTFGVAPAMLVVAVLMPQPDIGVPGPLSGDLAPRAMWMMVAVYVACGAMRLARFNVEHARADLPYRRFTGLPIPGAAVVLASLVWLHQHTLLNDRASEAVAPYLALALPFVAVALGLLMVSRIRYVHLANTYLRQRRPFGQVVWLIFVLAVFLWYKELVLAIGVCAYAASGPVVAAVRFVRSIGRKTDAPADTGETPEAASDSEDQRTA